MAYFDLSLEELQAYKPPRQEPPDFDLFWHGTLDEARNYPLQATFAAVDFGLEIIDAFDVTFNGFGGQPVKGWFLLPRRGEGQSTAQLPCVVEFIGYGGGRGFPFDWLVWPSAGYAHLVMDTRGQGSNWRNGDTPDVFTEGGQPHYPGFMTQGILDPHSYYYRRLFTDGVRAVEAARSHPAVDPEQIILTGASQGGGMCLAVGSLADGIAAILPDVPFLTGYRRATEITDRLPYAEISGYLRAHPDRVEQVFATLAYFDGVNFAARAKARALFSTALMDETCPPSTVFAAYNHYTAPKEMRVYTYNDHEGGRSHQTLEKIKFLRR